MKEYAKIQQSANTTLDTPTASQGCPTPYQSTLMLPRSVFTLADLSNTPDEILLRLEKVDIVSLIYCAQEALIEKRKQKEAELKPKITSDISAIIPLDSHILSETHSKECLRYKIALGILIDELVLKGKHELSLEISNIWKGPL